MTKDNNEHRNNYEMVKRYYDPKQTLGELTASKCKAKTAFTKAKHELIRVIKQSASDKEVQNCQLRLDECKRNVLAVQVKLASEYKKSEYKQCWKNTVKETDSIKEEYEEAHKMAENYLGRTMSTMSGSRSRQHSTSGAESFVTEDECTEIRINDGTIQDLDLNFGKLEALDLVREEHRKVDDLFGFQPIDRFKPLDLNKSSDDSVFEDELKFLKDGRRQTFQRTPFTQSMREIRTSDRVRKTKESIMNELNEEERRIRNRRRRDYDSSHLSQSAIEKGTRERTLSWDSSTVEDEKRIKDLRRLHKPPSIERFKQDDWPKSSHRLSGDISVFKGIDHTDWNPLDQERGESPFIYKGIEHYQGSSTSSGYPGKESNTMRDYRENHSTLFQPPPLRRSSSLRKHVSFGGFDFKKDALKERIKRNIDDHTVSKEYVPESLISVIENTKSFIKYNKTRVKLLEVLDSPTARRSKIKELQEMMRSAYNRLQDDIYILSEEYKRDIKRHESEMMSAYNMAQSYLDRKDHQLHSASSTSTCDLSLKDMPRKKLSKKSLTTDDLLVKFNR